ncbi:hypothetical protein [Bremerella alba]|uniref:Uncharacterized protein n=1 Tax=Bremerella alba TaxID=980252 RepID=A0A7V8V2V6_9BACT|nr:hypothetical protein [Bremerella alba]MBA2113907.1 hypothetical protein [Bremerella alba]
MPFYHSLRHLIRQVGLGILLLVACCGTLRPVQAETGETIHLPAGRDKPVSGLYLEIDTRWIDGSGYRPIGVTIATANGLPAPADRRLEITLRPQYYNFHSRNPFPAVTQEMKLSQGKVAEKHTLLVPQQFLWNSLEVITREDGQRLKELSSESTSVIMMFVNGQFTEAYPATIVFHRDAPKRDDRATWVLDQANRRDAGEEVDEIPDLRIFFNEQSLPTNQNLKSHLTGSPNQAISALPFLPRTDLLPLTDIPDTWQGLSSADLIVLERKDLETVARKTPERFAVLHQWILAGGNLLVWNAGENGSDAVDQLLAPNATNAISAWKSFPTNSVNERDLGIFDKIRHPRNRYAATNAANYVPLAVRKGKLIESDDSLNGSTPIAGTPLKLAARNEGFGKIVVVQGNPFPGTAGSWQRIFAVFHGDRLAWFQRYGMSRLRENLGFWEFLIPGVGVAPVTTFELLITLFVILIGPVNYFLLRSIGRLNFLIVTVPVGAFLVTAVLMSYAVLSDGLSTKSRIRTVTLLDQTTGRGASWSRQAYYAGLASTSGLTFPVDAAVYEYEQYPLTEHTGEKRMDWGEDQVLRGGYFRSRVTQQFLAIRPFQTARRLEVSTQEGKLSVKNELGTQVTQLILIDQNAVQYFAKDIRPDAESDLSVASSDQISEFRRTLNEKNLSIPDGFDHRTYVQRSSTRTNYYVQSSSMPEIFQREPSFNQSLMERELQNQMAHSFAALGPRSYIAIVEHFPETPLGLKTQAGEKSIEVVMGKW